MALQAGGNVGLWPRRLAASFDRVITFEPDQVSRACCQANVPANVDVRVEALGAASGRCGVKHRGLGSHRIVDGAGIEMTTIDTLNLEVLDLLQLDIEGYEHHALMGGAETIARCRPMIQVELRGFATKYGTTTNDTVQWLSDLGYRPVSSQPGSDVVFQWKAAA